LPDTITENHSVTHTVERKKRVNDLLVMVGIFAAWILLQTFILPKLGVST
jgi:hypothetical protein